MTDLKKVNNQLEYTWAKKLEDEVRKRDEKAKLQETRHEEKVHAIVMEHREDVRKLKTQFRDDVLVLDGELTKQVKERKIKEQAVQ